jgi:putative redox protein
MKTRKIFFQNAEGGKLAARIDFPLDGKVKAFALFAHCFTCNQNFNAIRNINNALTLHGIAVMRFDFTGLGESEGDFADTNFSSNVEDLVQAAAFLESHYEAPKLLVGHSLGGAAVLLAANRIPSVQAVATIGAPSEPMHVSRHFGGKIGEIRQSGIAEVELGGRPFTIKKQFLDDLEGTRVKEIVQGFGKALLILHSPQDTVVGIQNAADLYGYARHPKSFLSLDGADHLLSRKEDSLYAGTMICQWASRYMDFKEFPPLETHRQAVTHTGPSGYVTEIMAGKHSLIGDEPVSHGGEDIGPNPYDFVISGLGCCTGMTLRMYADRKKWPLDGVKVHLSHYKEEVPDDSLPEGKTKRIDVIERAIEIEGDLDQSQRERLLEIANRCPVHRTLHSEIDVRSSLYEE